VPVEHPAVKARPSGSPESAGRPSCRPPRESGPSARSSGSRGPRPGPRREGRGPRGRRSASSRVDEVRRDEEVELGRPEMPCGLNPSSGGFSGHSCTRFRCSSNSASRRGGAGGGPNLGDQEPALRQRKKSSVMLDSGAPFAKRNFGSPGLRDVEEEDAVLAFQQAQEPRRQGRSGRPRGGNDCGSFPDVPGGGIGTVLRTFP